MQADLPPPPSEAALQQLTGLEHLALRVMFREGGIRLEVPLAKTNPYLTHLDLSENGFGSIPTTIVGLERLQCLNISKGPLQLGYQCLAVLTSLPKLRTLDLRKQEWSEGYVLSWGREPDVYNDWNGLSEGILKHVREQLPQLHVLVGFAKMATPYLFKQP